MNISIKQSILSETAKKKAPLISQKSLITMLVQFQKVESGFICPHWKQDGIGTLPVMQCTFRQVVKASSGHIPQPFLIIEY